MGFRLRRTIRLGSGLRVNLSKGGASLSVGGHGITENIGRGGARTTLGLPGTGLSYTTTRRRGRAASGGFLVALIVLAGLAWLVFG